MSEAGVHRDDSGSAISAVIDRPSGRRRSDRIVGGGRTTQEAVDRMAGLTRQLLAFSRRQVLQPETLQLNAAVLDGSALLQRLIGSHIEMRLDLTAEPTWIRVDRAQLLQILMNLAINARDAMPEGGRLRIRTGRQGEHVLLAVSDSGTGIRAEDLPHIFERAYQGGEAQRTAGLGLGLYISRQVVELHGGQIEAASPPEGGARLTITLPTEYPAPNEQITPRSPCLRLARCSWKAITEPAEAVLA